nr:putative ribonuclease H-like domain-containing protein [Tanacetum cinerariifolium]
MRIEQYFLMTDYSLWEEEGIDYEEVFALVARIEAIRLFLAYASFMGFMVYKMDVKSAFLYGTIEEEEYVCQPPGFEDPDYTDKVYKVVKALYGLHQAPKAWMFGLTDGKSASIPIDTKKPLLKDLDVKRIFRYLKGKTHLGLWRPKDSPFNLTVVATSSTEAKHVAAASCCAQVLWIQNQLLDYGLILTAVSSKLMLFGLTIDAAHLMLLGHKTSVSIKKSNYVVRMQALIDKKKVTITEDSIRQALRLDDTDGVDYLLNEEIFAELARMGYEKPSTKITFYKAFFSAQYKFLIHIILQCMSAKRTAWNEFSSSMALLVICLPTCRNFNFSKYIFDSLVRNYSSPALIQKVFANMWRIGKGFLGVDTPLFDGILVQQQYLDVKDAAEDENDDNEVSVEPTPPFLTSALTPPPSPTQAYISSPPQAESAQPLSPPQQQPLQTAKISMTLLNTLLETCATLTKQGRLVESQAKVYHLDLEHAKKVLSMQDIDEADPAEVEEVIEVVTAAKLMTEVVTTAATPITAAQVPKASAPRKRRGVVIQDPKETATALVIMHSEAKSKDKGKGILIEEPKPLKRQAQIKQDEAFAKELEADLNANINWNDVMEQVKRKEKQDNTVMRYQSLKRKPEEVGSKRKDDSLKQRAAKKQRIDEETEELKIHLQIIANNDDDVYSEATPLSLKVHVVDSQIHQEHNKPYYKIIRADGTHQLFLSFITLLKNFNREDLKMLWKLVQERF